MRNHDQKKFVPESRPFKDNKICAMYRVTDQANQKYYAKFFLQRKLIDMNIFQSTQYNQTVLSDLTDEIFSQHFMQIKYTYSIPEGFIFVTQPYEYSLETYLKSKVIEEKEAIKIFQQIVKSVYSLYMAGFWHRNIRPEHFVKVNGIWKMESLVFNQNYQDAYGINSQFLWNPSYQPPQAYEKDTFSDQQLDEMVVWNLGSLLVDVLLGHHKLKDKGILDKYRNKPFSWKAIGIDKQCSEKLNQLLAKMLHYNKSERMKIDDLFRDQYLCAEVARIHKKGDVRKNRIYVAGVSNLSQNLKNGNSRNQEILNAKGFKKDREDMEASINESVIRKNKKKLETQNQMLNKIKAMTQQDKQYTNQKSANALLRNSEMKNFIANNYQSRGLQAYKSYYDKCQLLLITSERLQEIKDIISNETLLLNKFALTFVALNTLYRLSQSMNRNLNYLNMDSQAWSQFQESAEFQGFKQIMNYRTKQTHHLLGPLKQVLHRIPQWQKDLMKIKQVEQLLNCNYKNIRFPLVKLPYRKIIKKCYDSISKVYNSEKNQNLVRIGMYVAFCMTIDKMYIPDDIPDNFQPYFQWMKIQKSPYVSMDNFQEYLDNAQKRILISHSVYILKKYFSRE